MDDDIKRDAMLRAGGECTLITPAPEALRGTPGTPPTPQEDCEVAERRLLRAVLRGARGNALNEYADLVCMAHRLRSLKR